MTSTYTTNHVLVISSISIVLSLHVLRFRFNVYCQLPYQLPWSPRPLYRLSCNPQANQANCQLWWSVDSYGFLLLSTNRILNGDKGEILLGDGRSWYVMGLCLSDIVIIVIVIWQCSEICLPCAYFVSWMCFQFACKHCCNCFEGLFQIAESQTVSSEGLSGFNDWSSISSEDINPNGGFWSLEWFLTVLVFQNGVSEISECPCFLKILTLWE